MRILITEDNLSQRNCLISLINDFFEKYNITFSITCADKSDEIHNLILNISNYDLVFLDIEFNELNGIDIAMEIRRKTKDIKIIFTSNFDKYLIDGYKAHADRYFLKPIKKNIFEIEMLDIIQNYILNNKYIVHENFSPHKIYLKDILYIEKLQRKSIVYLTNNQVIQSSHTLKWWIEFLNDKRFVQCHRSFFVNMQNIKTYNKKEIYLTNNTNIPLSKFYYNSLNEEFSLYLNSLC